MSCAICHVRKEKRFCLALHDRICPQCCGEQREVTIDCPSECPYLQQARQREKPRELDETQREDLFPKVQLREDFLLQHEPLIGGLLRTILRLSRSDRNLRDRDILNALSTMARSYQTLVDSGLVYQQASANPAQAAMIDILQKSIDGFRHIEQQHRGYIMLRDSDVFLTLVFMTRFANMHTNGRPLSRAFLDALAARVPDSETPDGVAEDNRSRIILP